MGSRGILASVSRGGTDHTGLGSMKTKAKVALAAIAMAGACVYSSAIAAVPAHAEEYCSQAYPYPPPGAICTKIGYIFGEYCNPSPYCSPVPGMPGTQNPDGYTLPWCTPVYVPGCRNY